MEENRNGLQSVCSNLMTRMSLRCLMNPHTICLFVNTCALLLDHAHSELCHTIKFSMCLHSQTGDYLGVCHISRPFDHLLETHLCGSLLSRHTYTCSMMLRGGADTSSSSSIEGLESLPTNVKKKIKELLKRKDALTSGKFGVCFDDLDPLNANIVDPLNPPDRQSRLQIQSYRTCNNVLKRYLIQDVNTVTGCKDSGKDGTVRHIGLNGCPYTIFNQPDNGLSEGAHICPLSYECHKEWEKLHRFRLNLPFTGSLSPNEQKRYDVWFYGYKGESSTKGSSKENPRSESGRKDTPSGEISIVEKASRKVIHSGYIHSAPNFIRIHYQFKLLDQIPSFILIPYGKTAKQLWGWCGEALEFLVIALNPSVFVDIKASLVGSDAYISCEDPDVARAFDVFAEVMSVVLGVVCVDGVESAPTKDNVRAVRTALKKSGQFQYLGLRKDCNGFVRKVCLDRGKISAPGKRAEPWSRFKAHPSPEPINVMCRSLNAMQTYLYNRNALNGVKKKMWVKTAKTFPSCLEYEGSAQCFLCRAHFILHDEQQYAYLSCEERDRLSSVASLHYRERFSQ